MAEPGASAASAATPADPALRLARLRARPRRPGEASCFVSREELPITTTLGSCIACCLWDRVARVGGMNHVTLPDGVADSGRYGGFAMQRLIDELLLLGATRSSLRAKVSGGGQVLAGIDSLKLGEHNTRFVFDNLRAECIPVVGKDVLERCPRKVCFLPSSGQAWVKRLASAPAAQRFGRKCAAAADSTAQF